MIIFSEATIERAISKSAQDNQQLTELAKMLGCRIFYIPSDFDLCETAENALWQVPEQEQLTNCFWIGFIPSLDKYTEVYNEALKKNIKLLNSPKEHQMAQEFDLSYPFLTGLTPESVVLSNLDDCEKAIELLGLPLFIRGSAKSKKSSGWKACVANTKDQLHKIVINLLNNSFFTRDRVIVRKFVNLRYDRTSDQDFPFGREYRVFLYNQEILGYGYYWDGDDPLMDLSTSEENIVLDLAQETAKRLPVTFIAVDIGQLVDGSWIVIEVNDGQFAGTGHMELLPFWNNLLNKAK